MKSKKELEQQKAKRRHLEEKQRRRSEPNLSRTESTKEEKPIILIVCGGKNTEPLYFKKFKLSTATIKIAGKGINPSALVNNAIKLREKEEYESTWCVFDKDDFPTDDFNSAIQTASDHGINVAYSNQAFEYWFLLHFEDHQGGPMPRADYHHKINEYLSESGISYDGKGSKIVSDDFFNLMLGTDSKTGKRRVDLAIFRSERNFNKLDHKNPAGEESSTTVFLLARLILKYI